MTELCKIFEDYKSDKCPNIFHSYSTEYFNILKDKKHDIKNVLEIGVGTNEIMSPICGKDYKIGASLKSWRDFFPNSKIIGLDINEEVLFEDERIKCFYTDQSNEITLEKTISNINTYYNENIEYDLIIDDGSHVKEHMILTFETYKKYLTSGGLYIIEDIKFHELPIFINLETNEFVIKKIHNGTFEWDSFVVFQKI